MASKKYFNNLINREVIILLISNHHTAMMMLILSCTSQTDFLDTCTGFIIENYLTTNASYPITYGTTVTVACDPAYDLLGSKVITCEEGIVYSHSSRRPKCVNKGR